jgi:hypothetical protein
MTVEELLAAFKGEDPKSLVRLSIGNPKDTCFTNEVTAVEVEEGTCTIRGWVASDNEEACAPWSDHG